MFLFLKTGPNLNGFLFDFFIFLLALLISLFDFFSASVCSILIIISSLRLLLKSRGDKCLLLLFSLYFYINSSFVLSDILQLKISLGDDSLIWQESIRHSGYSSSLVIYITLFTTSFNFLLTKSFFTKAELSSDIEIYKKHNPIVFYSLYFVSLVFWFFGYSSERGHTYDSVTFPFYEYCLVIFPVMWFYSGKGRLNNFLLWVFVVLYVAQSLLRGDRSSAFPMLILIFLLSNININLLKVFVVLFLGLVLNSFVAIYRIDFSSQSLLEVLSILPSNINLTSDTVSQSYYTALSIFAAADKYDYTAHYFLNFLIGIVIGGGYQGADVINLSYEYYMNKAGGFYFSWFYFWFGFSGFIIASVILSLIFRFIFISPSPYAKLFKFTLIVFFIRWYVYTPFVLFRSVLFVLSVLLITSFVVNYFTRSFFNDK